MLIAQTSTYTLGRFTIHQRPLFDNPAFCHFLVFLGQQLVGKQFSVPSESDCDWLLSQVQQTRYAERVTVRRVYSKVIKGRARNGEPKG